VNYYEGVMTARRAKEFLFSHHDHHGSIDFKSNQMLCVSIHIQDKNVYFTHQTSNREKIKQRNEMQSIYDASGSHELDWWIFFWLYMS
jgi:hypothetical protein